MGIGGGGLPSSIVAKPVLHMGPVAFVSRLQFQDGVEVEVAFVL